MDLWIMGSNRVFQKFYVRTFMDSKSKSKKKIKFITQILFHI